MKKIRIAVLTLIILINTVLAEGCWNYREIEKLAIVSGVAIDKGPTGKYLMTAEIIKASSGKNTKIVSEIITMEGDTIFDAARNGISISGNRLYWSHSEVVILSKEIASEGLIKVIDWYTRDSETREDVYILISKGDTAREIFGEQGITEKIISFELADMIKNQKNLSKAPKIDVLEFDNNIEAKGISAVAPVINMKEINGKKYPQIMGTAIFKKDKLAGFLNGEETKLFNFIKNEVKGGVLVEKLQGNDVDVPVTLEIFNSNTKVVPVVDSNNIKININIDTAAAIAEIEGTENYIEDEAHIKLEKNAEKVLKKQIESLIKKIQSEYGQDIFGFGTTLRNNKTKVWKRYEDNWEETFTNLEVKVTTKVHIRNSALLSKPLEVGD